MSAISTAVNVPGVQRKSHVHICMACIVTVYPNQQQPGFFEVNFVHENAILEMLELHCAEDMLLSCELRDLLNSNWAGSAR
jgi:hypothetical protein